MSRLGLEVKALSCWRSSQPLFAELSFNLSAGQILQILGPNGVGKSTLLRALAGLRAPTGGVINWHGSNILEDVEIYQSQLAYLGHKLALKSHLTVIESLNLDLRFQAPETQINQILKQFELDRCRDLEINLLSQGQQQRLALLGIILSKKPLWLLDEPFAALDSQIIDHLQYEFQLHLQAGGVIILTSHRPLTKAALNYKTLQLERS